jgi:hypothetical protein
MYDNRDRPPPKAAFSLLETNQHIHLFFAYTVSMFDPNAHLPRINKVMIYLGACLIAGIRLASETHVNHRQIPTSDAINQSVDLAHEIYNRVFRKVPERLNGEKH